MIGKTVSHYEIVRKIGQGGMGVVYEARDLKLPRSVALKFLPDHVHADADTRKRFLHEARAISALDHPNITVIHEIDETPKYGQFIVMPYYEGRMLAAIVAEGPLALESAIGIVSQIGSGLSKAHEKGIIHRDIKPANILVTTDGIVKILDFGLARLVDQTRITKSGLTVGTARYMSPEQATSGKVDHRTDIWSLSVLFYEMLTRESPFLGDTEAALVYSIVNSAPREIHGFRDDIPGDVASVIEKGMQKDPDDRYQRVGDFLRDLGVSPPVVSAVPAHEATGELSIAVLPFDDISPDKDNEYFSDGLAEEVITDLSRIQGLRVISRNSAMVFKGTDKDIRTIGLDLDVRYVVRGSVRKAGNDLRINAHLIDVPEDATLWTEKFAGSLDDVFDIQEKVSRAIVDALNVELSPQESERVAAQPISDVRAYEYFLRARQDIYLAREDTLDRAVDYLQRGLDIAGENALLYAGMAQAHFQYVNVGFRGLDHLETAEHCVERVLTLEPKSPHGHRLKGLIAFLRKQFQESVTHFKQALGVDPNDVDSMFWLIHAYILAGRTEVAAPLVEKLLKIDPLTPINQTGPAWIHFFEGRFEMALESIRGVYETYPGEPAFRYQYVQILVYSDRLKQANKVIDALESDAPEHPLAMLCLLLKHSLQGKKSRAQKALTPELQGLARSDPAYSWFVATCFALLNQTAEALDWLEHAVATGFINYPFLAQHDRLLDGLRDERGFKRLLDRARDAWEQFTV